MKFAEVTQNLKISIEKHSPEILTGFGIAGMLTTTILAVKATPKALRLIEDKKKEKEVTKLTVLDTVKTTWKCYIPAAGLAVVSTGCLVGASKVSLKRNAVLATAYKVVETAHKEYREKVIETLGEKKEEAIRDKVAKQKLDDNPVQTNQVIVVDRDKTLCFDVFSGRYFEVNIDRIKRAENTLNRRMMLENYVSLNDFYEEIGLEPTPLGDELGWKIDNGFLNLDLSSQLTPDDRPALVINYNVAPVREYYKLY